MDPFTSALDQAAAIRKGEVSSAELVRMYLDRIERYNPKLNAYFLVTPELALEQSENGDGNGRLGGVPVSIKDLVCLAGHPTTYGSRAYADFVTDFDQFPVAQLKKAGCPILGKTTTPEFGSRPVTEFGYHGTARNPWNPEHTTGGSSGGAAGALAAGLCALSHGTDGGGSVRIPASCCGLVGLKPSRGRISRGPVQGEGWAGLSTDGVLARTVEDAAAGLDAMAGHLPGDPYWAEVDGSFLDALKQPSGLRISFSVKTHVPVHPEIAACVERAVSICEEAGHQVEEGGPDTLAFRELEKTIILSGTAAWEVEDVSMLDPINRDAFERVKTITGADYYKAITNLRIHSRKVVAFWDTRDVLITPTLVQPPPRHGALGADPATAHDEDLDWLPYTYPYNCTGQPAISLPLGMTRDGLPIGVQLVGPPRGEQVILDLALQLQEAMPWKDRRPPAFA
jgi:amidase